jgi:hypothetical protein
MGWLTFAALMTCLPRPLPSEAPSMIPGKSRICISAPPYSNTPGMAVSVVKAYAATSALVFVIFDKNVDLPTEGKPTSAMRASPDLETSNPEPAPPPAPGPGSRSWALSRASLLCSSQHCGVSKLAVRLSVRTYSSLKASVHGSLFPRWVFVVAQSYESRAVAARLGNSCRFERAAISTRSQLPTTQTIVTELTL